MVTCMKIVITSEFLSMFWWFGIFNAKPNPSLTNVNLPCWKWKALEATALLPLPSLLIWYSQCQAKPAHLIWTCPPLTTANGNNSRTGISGLCGSMGMSICSTLQICPPGPESLSEKRWLEWVTSSLLVAPWLIIIIKLYIKKIGS